MAGVNVTQSGGSAGAGSTIIIRGGNSASEGRDNQPLFVVDGIIYDNSTVIGGNSGTDGMMKTATTFSNRVMDINPEDIESMSVLKELLLPLCTVPALLTGNRHYYQKGANDGTVRVNVGSKYSYSWASSLPELQDVYGRGYFNQAGVFSDYTYNSWGQKSVEKHTTTSENSSAEEISGTIRSAFPAEPKIIASTCQLPATTRKVSYP